MPKQGRPCCYPIGQVYQQRHPHPNPMPRRLSADFASHRFIDPKAWVSCQDAPEAFVIFLFPRSAYSEAYQRTQMLGIRATDGFLRRTLPLPTCESRRLNEQKTCGENKTTNRKRPLSVLASWVFSCAYRKKSEGRTTGAAHLVGRGQTIYETPFYGFNSN